MHIKESAENYLEAIYMIKKNKGSVRSIDVAKELGFSKPSVSVAVKNFVAEGLVELKEDGTLALTKKGEKIAKSVYERHELIAKLLITLGVSEETAYEDSCKIEHNLSEETFSAIKNFYETYKKD